MTKSVFAYRNGVLCAEALPLAEIAEEVGTPFYCMSAKQLQRNFRCFVSPFSDMDATFHYSVKANANLAVIKVLSDCGAGADVSSSGELERALEGGVLPEKIVFSGLGKTDDDIAAALLANVAQINVESISELFMIDTVANILGKRVPIVLRINLGLTMLQSDVFSGCGKDVRAGIDLDNLADALQYLLSSNRLVFKGLAVHIEEDGQDYGVNRRCYEHLASVVRLLRTQGIMVDCLDLGGGTGPFGSAASAPFSDYVSVVKDTVGTLGCLLQFEPGHKLVGGAGVLVSRILHVNKAGGKKALILDAGINDLMAPVLRNTKHEIIPVREHGDGPLECVNIVGPICDNKDAFGGGYVMPESVKTGDLIAIMEAGAYGSVMASGYCGRALIPEVLVSGAQHAIIRRRVAVAEQMGWESIPDWMVISRAA